VCSKLVWKYAFDDKKNTVTNIQHHLVPGYCQFCFVDVKDISDIRSSNLTTIFQEAFPETQFIRIQHNRAIFGTVSDLVRCDTYNSDRNGFLRRVYNREMPTFDKVLYIPYRQPVDSARWEEFKTRILQ